MDPPSQTSDRKPVTTRERISRALAAAGVVIAVAIFVWIGRGIIDNWDEVAPHLAGVSAWVLIGAALIFFVFTALTSYCYYASLRLAGAEVRAFDAMSVYWASQLGKYIPGKVTYVAGQIGLATWLRIPVAQSVLGFTASQILIVAAGALIASPLLGGVLQQGAFVILVVLAAAGFAVVASGVWVRPFNILQRKRRKPELETFSPLHAVRALLAAVAAWVAYAVFAAVIGAALATDASAADAARIGMAAVAAWLLGFLSFITPAGMGVREGAFVILTRGILPEPNAMAVALIMRLLYTSLQLIIGALALTWSIRRRPRQPAD